MNDHAHHDHERMKELLAERAIFGLSEAEASELNALLKANPHFDADQLDRIAAMVDLSAVADRVEGLPQHLAKRILAERSGLERHDRGDQASLHALPISAAPARLTLRRREVVAWLTAAACLVLAFCAWMFRSQTGPSSQPTGNGPVLSAKDSSPSQSVDSKVVRSAAELAIAQMREQLLASATDVLRIKLVASEGEGAVQITGDIVWSGQRQAGFVRLSGLKTNDRAQSRYQLWIIDNNAPGNEFVNGGVFNVDDTTRELILPIQPSHFIRQPRMFLFSMEPLDGGRPLITPLMAKADDTAL